MTVLGRRRDVVRSIALSIVSHVVLLILTAIFVAVAAFFPNAWRGNGFSATLTLPAWLVFVIAATGLFSAFVAYLNGRRASVVRGREDATKVNVELLASRDVLSNHEREVRSTRFGKWPLGEDLSNRKNFRKELDKAITEEETLVQRIWNISSLDDLSRLKEMIEKYRGRENHHIRAYLGVPDHVMPELLIVEKRGASIAFASRNRQQSLDSVILFKRPDLVGVIRGYFDVLWERADLVFQGGELAAGGEELLRGYEQKLTKPQATP